MTIFILFDIHVYSIFIKVRQTQAAKFSKQDLAAHFNFSSCVWLIVCVGVCVCVWCVCVCVFVISWWPKAGDIWYIQENHYLLLLGIPENSKFHVKISLFITLVTKVFDNVYLLARPTSLIGWLIQNVSPIIGNLQKG